MAFLTVRLLDESKHHTIPYMSTINKITIANSLPSWANALERASILVLGLFQDPLLGTCYPFQQHLNPSNATVLRKAGNEVGCTLKQKEEGDKSQENDFIILLRFLNHQKYSLYSTYVQATITNQHACLSMDMDCLYQHLSLSTITEDTVTLATLKALSEVAAATRLAHTCIVRLRAVGLGVALTNKRYRLASKSTVGDLQQFLRGRLEDGVKVGDGAAVLIFVGGFNPQPAQQIGELHRLFRSTDDELLVSYSLKEAWG